MGGVLARSGRWTRLAAKRRHASKVAEDGPDAVICHLCRKRFRSVNAMHLWAAHGRDSDHPVREYERRYGLRVAACRSTVRTMRRNRIAVVDRAGHHWPRARVLAELRRRAAAGKSMAASRLPLALLESARRRFGLWETAMRRAGLDPSEHRLHRRWDREAIVDAIRRLRRAGEPLSDLRVRERHHALYRAAFRAAGSWGAALRMAGLDPKRYREPPKWTLAIARSWLRDRVREGRSFETKEVPPGLVSRIRRETGLNWPSFVESLGSRYAGLRHRTDWTDAAVIDEIRERRRKGLPLNIDAARANGQALTHQARNRFGSWTAALRAAGVAPKPLHRRWTRRDVTTAIRARQDAGQRIDRAGAIVDDHRLVRAGERMFRSWGRALGAAGLDPSQARRPFATPPPRRSRPR